MTFFEGENFHDFAARRQEALRQELSELPDSELLNVNAERLAEALVMKYNMHPLEFHFEALETGERRYQEEAPDSDLWRQASYDSGIDYEPEYVNKTSHWVQIPFSGEDEFFYVALQAWRGFPGEVSGHIEGNRICLEFTPNRYASEEDLLTRIVHILRDHEQRVKAVADRFNQELLPFALDVVLTRKAAVARRRQALLKLNIPLDKTTPPPALAVPAPEFRKRIVVVERGEFKPEPTLREEDYQELLTIFFELGKVFERLPSLYQGKGEEALRDLILMNLVMRIQGTATGETYNVRGKTDILLRYENSNLFVAECKFWGGPTQYLETIDQLLSYLSWRDSKAAVIIFVRGTKISTVLNGVERETPTHKNHVAFVSRPADSWFNHRFHLNGDPDRVVQVAVLVIHVPPI